MCEWISCKDRMPEENERILFCVEGSDDEVSYGYFLSGEWREDGYCYPLSMVKYWMRIPGRPTLIHKCQGKTGNLEAVTECAEDKAGTLWVSNGEYDSQVNFCPFCGYEAKVKVE
jgi:Protein of unknown function (DUF551)